MEGPWRVFYRPGSPKISLAGSILGSILGSMKVHEGSLNLGEVQQAQYSGRKLRSACKRMSIVHVRAGYMLGILFALLIQKYFILFYVIFFCQAQLQLQLQLQLELRLALFPIAPATHPPPPVKVYLDVSLPSTSSSTTMHLSCI